jgi:hypothetical protein
MSTLHGLLFAFFMEDLPQLLENVVTSTSEKLCGLCTVEILLILPVT